MDSDIVLIYDGECPFCNKFAQLVELRGCIPSLKIKDGRDHLDQLKSLYLKGYDLNNGAILLVNEKILHGAEAVTWICSQTERPSGPLLNLLVVVFSSSFRTNALFPVLVWSRRIALLFKNISFKPVY